MKLKYSPILMRGFSPLIVLIHYLMCIKRVSHREYLGIHACESLYFYNEPFLYVNVKNLFLRHLSYFPVITISCDHLFPY